MLSYDPKVFVTTKGTRYLKEPGVALIHQPKFDPMAFTTFVNSYGDTFDAADYENDFYFQGAKDLTSDLALDDGAAIVKAAGQLCYLSFGEKRSRTVDTEKYINNIMSSKHGCYDAETDVLTKGGWKRWPDVTEQDEFATINENARIEYHKPKRLVRYQHSGRMYRVDARGVDLLVTPDHKMLVCVTTTRKGRKRDEFSLIEAKNLDATSHAYLKCGSWLGGSSDIIQHDHAALLGFAIGDGTTMSRYRVSFHLRRERKIAWLRRLTDRLGYKVIEDGDKYTVWLPEGDERISNLFSAIYDEEREKVIPHGLLTNCDEGTLHGLFEGLMQSDGHHGETGDSFDTTSQKLVGQFQQLCLHIGLAANVCYTYDSDDRPTSFGTKPLTRLSVIRRELKPEVNKYIDGVGKTSWIEGWSGEVFCAEVPNNTLYVRRNGKPVWSGNSVLEHVNYGVVIWGIDRACSHEEVRHRAGTAYSQMSQRYVDGKTLRFVEREEYQNNERLHAMFEEHIDHCSDEYDFRASLLQIQMAKQLADVSPTERRKAVNSAARNCLPNETETAMVMTGNVRAWRHIIEMRASKFADSPIRTLTLRIHEILNEAAPFFFGDFERKEGDGKTWLEPKYSKV